MFQAQHSTLPYSRMRNCVLDVVRDGKARDTIHFTFEVDVTNLRAALHGIKVRGIRAPSITSHMIHCFAKVVGEREYKLFNSYRKGRNQLVVFDDVDVAIPVEKEVEGYMQPVYHIVRAANNKDVDEIQLEIDRAKGVAWDDVMPGIDKAFFGKWPGFLRRAFWAIARARPKVRKFFSGTVGVTSVGMFGSGSVHLFPLTPMTTTLAVGGIDAKTVLVDGRPLIREMLCMTLCVDHDIIDGAPAMRFITRFKEVAESCFELPRASLLDETAPPIVPLNQGVGWNHAVNQS
ncbi:MAG: 2-oxo acid dehydrogenase subunit E2 [Candidatus Lokiarchaeota archaeon]|nr:2-oxo acid dehydrogenase subunit E2 [Candidatus Lokiarchaeota archaeon]